MQFMHKYDSEINMSVFFQAFIKYNPSVRMSFPV